ncbi:MAG: SRPBCC family protein [Phycisphaerales bacterium]
MTREHQTEMTAPTDREFVLMREFDVPRDLLWKVWTDPAHLAKWWGPTGFSTTTHSQDLREGGSWRFTMHGPDGHDYPNHIRYTTIREPEHLAYEHVEMPGDEPACFQAEGLFEQIGDNPPRTRVTFRMIFPTAEDRERIVKTYGAGDGAIQTFNRLAEHVKRQTGSDADKPFVLTRFFEAPRQLVYDAWTRQEHLAKWFGPPVVTLSHCTLDLRVGGTFHYEMKFPGGDHWGRWVFREISPPERLVFTCCFSDEHGGVARSFFDQRWPLEWLNVVTFEPHAGLKKGTVVRLESWPVNASQGERDTFRAGHDSMTQGWGGTLDKLDAFLAGRLPSSAARSG